MPIVQVDSRFCPRKLGPGQVKRYMSKGPLFGYMVGCPGCGFRELHLHEQACFVEVEPNVLFASTKPVRCMACGCSLSFAGGVALAVPSAS